MRHVLGRNDLPPILHSSCYCIERAVLEVCFLWTTVELHDPCNLIEHSQHRKRSGPINRWLFSLKQPSFFQASVVLQLHDHFWHTVLNTGLLRDKWKVTHTVYCVFCTGTFEMTHSVLKNGFERQGILLFIQNSNEIIALLEVLANS